MSEGIRCALYVRTSTSDRQDTAMQIRDLESYAKTRGWNVVKVFEDKGFTGTNSNRPALKALLCDARARKFDLILVWRLDRFGRSLREIVLMLQDLADYGVEFCSLKDSLDLSTSQGKLMLHIVAAFAQYEAEIIKSRVRSGLENAKAKGQKLGRPKKRNDAEIKRLREEGLSIRQIAKQLGISPAAVQRALKKPVSKTHLRIAR